jgi:CheY-like chemotaxis protein
MTQGSEPRFNYRILLIDDDGVRTSGAMVLRGTGHEVHAAEHGFRGLTALSRSLPDLIISDLKMPGIRRRIFVGGPPAFSAHPGDRDFG